MTQHLGQVRPANDPNKGVVVKSLYVTDLAAGDDLLNEPFLLEDVVRRETKDGRPFLLSTYRDRTGEISGVFWDVPPDVESWVRPGVVTLVTGRVSSYKNTLQINTTDLNPMAMTDMDQFLPSAERSLQDMVAELREVVGQLAQPWQAITRQVLLEPSFLEIYSTAPAARTLHHAYVGGLLEHSLSMARIASFLADYYPYVNKDLLIAGTLLHDLGKALEYDTKASFEFSDDGRLVGHIVRSIVIVEKAAAQVDAISDAELRQLVHLIASHHGTMEWGSPVVPKTLEAVLLHQLDLLDSRVQGFFDHLHDDTAGERWTSKPSYMFGTELLRPPRFE